MLDMLQNMLTGETLLVYGAALLAMISTLAVGIPLLQRGARHQRIEQVVAHRAYLAQEARKSLASRPQDMIQTGSAERRMADFFKLQKLSGGVTIRERLVAAGYRKPQHVMIFFTARLALAALLPILATLLMLNFDKPLSGGIFILALLGCAAFGYALPGISVKNQGIKRGEHVRLVFPDCLDLMLVCVEGGLGIEAAIQTVSRDIAPSSRILAEEFGLLGAELAFLGDRSEALRNFATRLQEPTARSFVNALLQAEKYGTPLAQALRVMSAELRDRRFSEAEKKAAALPPKLTVPMIGFFMPTLFITILGPAIIQALRTASGM